MKFDRVSGLVFGGVALASLAFPNIADAAQCGIRTCPSPTPVVPQGSCQASNSVSVLVSGSNVVAYVPQGSWSEGASGIGVINIEGTSITPTLVATPNVVNSCSTNGITAQTVCTANNTDVYLLKGTSLTKTLSSSGSGTVGFSGGSCTNCSVAMDAVHNKAVLGLAIGGVAGFQYLDLATSTFETPFASKAGAISENILVDPSRNLLLSPSELNIYELINIANTTAPLFYEAPIAFSEGVESDSAGEDCATGIALASGEFSSPSAVLITDLTQAVFTSGSPGKWTAPSQIQTLTESFLSAGASGLAVAQGSHIGIVTGEFGGSAITAIALPTTSGVGVPAITDWVSCNLPDDFQMGFDPHTVTAYKSPNGGQDAIAVISNSTASQVAVVDLTKMLNPSLLPRTSAGHGCAAGALPTTLVNLITVPSSESTVRVIRKPLSIPLQNKPLSPPLVIQKF